MVIKSVFTAIIVFIAVVALFVSRYLNEKEKDKTVSLKMPKLEDLPIIQKWPLIKKF